PLHSRHDSPPLTGWCAASLVAASQICVRRAYPVTHWVATLALHSRLGQDAGSAWGGALGRLRAPAQVILHAPPARASGPPPPPLLAAVASNAREIVPSRKAVCVRCHKPRWPSLPGTLPVDSNVSTSTNPPSWPTT